MDLIEELKREEGFRPTVYKDHLGKDTIGYGTLMPLTEPECDWLLRNRLSVFIDSIDEKFKDIQLHPTARDILYLMAYQMGLAGVMKFKKMIEALRVGNYYQASLEMSDSQWYRQTPKRASRLITQMQQIKG